MQVGMKFQPKFTSSEKSSKLSEKQLYCTTAPSLQSLTHVRFTTPPQLMVNYVNCSFGLVVYTQVTIPSIRGFQESKPPGPKTTNALLVDPTWRIVPVSKWLVTMVSKSPK